MCKKQKYTCRYKDKENQGKGNGNEEIRRKKDGKIKKNEKL